MVCAVSMQELSRLTALSRLVIDSNSLRELPRVVLQLPSLTVLQASHNSITHLPEDLGQMAALQALMLSGNQVSSSCTTSSAKAAVYLCIRHLLVVRHIAAVTMWTVLACGQQNMPQQCI